MKRNILCAGRSEQMINSLLLWGLKWVIRWLSCALICFLPALAFAGNSSTGNSTIGRSTTGRGVGASPLQTSPAQISQSQSSQIQPSQQFQSSQSQPTASAKLALPHKERLMAVTVITSRDIERCIGCDFADILEHHGVGVLREGENFYKSADSDRVFVGLRGSGDKHTILMVDGVRKEDSTLSEPWWPYIALHDIERIEIVRGPQGGDSGIAGVVHVFTKRATCGVGEFCSSARLELSNESETGKTFALSGHTRTEQSGFRLNFQEELSRGRRFPDFLTVDRSGPEFSNQYREWDLSFSFDHTSKDDKWQWDVGSSFHNARDEGNIRPSAVSRGDNQVNHLGVTYYLSPDLMFKSLLGYNKEEHTKNTPLPPYPSKTGTSRRLSLKLLGEYHFDFPNGSEDPTDYVLIAGVEGIRDRVSSQPVEIYEDRERDTRAVFSSLSGSRDPFAYQVEVRADDVSGYVKEQVFTWRGDASYRVARLNLHDMYVRGGVGTGFRVPGFDEQNFENSEGEKFDWELERSQTGEVGLRLEKDTSNFIGINFFKTRLEHQYTAREAPPNQVALIPVIHKNRGFMQGVEVESKFKVGLWDGRVSYVFTDPDDLDWDFKQHNPVRHLSTVETYYALTPRWTFGTQMVYRGKRDRDIGPLGNVDEVYIFDLRGFYKFNKHVNLGLAVENVTDEKYEMYPRDEGPRRTLWFTLDLRY